MSDKKAISMSFDDLTRLYEECCNANDGESSVDDGTVWLKIKDHKVVGASFDFECVVDGHKDIDL